MDDLENLLNKSEFKFILYDRPFELIVQESNDVAMIKSYLRTMIEDFEEAAIEDMILATKEYGLFEGNAILQFLGVE